MPVGATQRPGAPQHLGVDSSRGQYIGNRPVAISSATETDDNDDMDETTEAEGMEPSPIGAAAAAHGGLVQRRGTLARRPVHAAPMSRIPEFPQLEVERPVAERLGTFRVRALWTFILVISFLVILAAGHFYTSLLVLILTILVYREVIALKRNIEKDKKLPLFFVLRWYWFLLTIYGTSYMWILPLADGLGLPRYYWLRILVSHHLIITYSCALLGLVLFIMSLRRFSLRYQFSQFALLLLTCLFVVGQAMFQIINIYDGLIWFFISSSAVIVNDVSAYVFGIFFGRTRLINLSPKKTVEGFLGASATTIVWTVAVSAFLLNYQVFVCPQPEVTFRPFAMWRELRCDPHPAFKPYAFELPHIIASLTGLQSVVLRSAWIHCFVLGVFAAFFAPFGGFFASALKRALRVKDFGASIPGHGGITDRFDCQLIMGMFTFLYVRTFVFRNVRGPSVDQILRLIDLLPADEKMRLLDLVHAVST